MAAFFSSRFTFIRLMEDILNAIKDEENKGPELKKTQNMRKQEIYLSCQNKNFTA